MKKRLKLITTVLVIVCFMLTTYGGVPILAAEFAPDTGNVPTSNTFEDSLAGNLQLSAQPSDAPQNLLVNPGFEDGLSGWQYSTSPQAFTVSFNTARTGSKSVLLQGDGKWGCLRQLVEVEPDCDYEFRFYSRGSTTNEPFKVLDINLAKISDEKKVQASEDWVLNTLEFNSSSNETVYVYIGNGSIGNALYIDDVELIGKAPAVPEMNPPVAGDTNITVSWNAVAGARGYVIKYGTSADSLTLEIEVTNSVSETVYGLANGTTYYFAVSAYNDYGSSEMSSTVSAQPSDAPQNLLVNPGFENGLSGWWQSFSEVFTVSDATARTGSKSVLLQGDGKWGCLRQLVEVEPDCDYEFRFYSRGSTTSDLFKILDTDMTRISDEKKVQASEDWVLNTLGFNSGSHDRVYVYIGNGSIGNTLYIDDVELIRTPVEVPAVPEMNPPVAGNTNITVSWNAVARARGYVIKYGTSADSLTSEIEVTDGVSKTVYGLANGTTYYFAVSAYNDYGSSEMSSTVSAQPSDAPQNLLVNSGFEDGLSGWWQSSPQVFTVSDATARTGSKSVLLSGNGNWSCLRQLVEVEPDCDYEFRFYSRGSTTNEHIKILDTNMASISDVKMVQASEDWVLNTLEFNSSSNNMVHVYIGSKSLQNALYIDDAELIGPPPTGQTIVEEEEPYVPVITPSVFSNFITRQGDRLFDGSNELRFISCNVPCMLMVEEIGFTLPIPWEQEDAFKSVAQMGGQVIRTYTLTVKNPADQTNTKYHVYRDAQGNIAFDEDFFVAMDYALAFANMYGVRLIIPLIDQWSHHGGITEFAAFRNKSKDEFWTDSEIRTDFKTVISYVLNRTNTLTGVQYKNDPAVLAWEVGNELLPPSNDTWTPDIAAYIKSIDQNHLVLDGFQGVRQASLEDDNIDMVSNHGYRALSNKDMVAIARNGRAASIGIKPFIMGEFGFAPTDEYINLMNEVVDNGSSGALLWCLRYHQEKGGFYWEREEDYKTTTYYAYHWPGFAADDRVDGTNVLNLVREYAYKIRGMDTPPALSVPEAPKMFKATRLNKLYWRGSAGASTYELERTVSLNGQPDDESWTTVRTDISDYIFGGSRPYATDRTAVPGTQYFYRMRAVNAAGLSETSNAIGPLSTSIAGSGSNKGSGIAYASDKGFIRDDANDLSRIYSYQGNLYSDNANPQYFAGDTGRIARSDDEDADIIYASEGNMNAFKVETYFSPDLAKIADFTFCVSSDNSSYTAVDAMQTLKTAEDSWKKITYESYSLPANTKYLKIRFNDKTAGSDRAAQIGSVLVSYGDEMLPVPDGLPIPKDIDTFEDYAGGNADLQTAYVKNSDGSNVTVTLSSNNKKDGYYGMKYVYSLDSTRNYAGVEKTFDDDSWAGKDALQFWVKPDGSGHTLTFQVEEAEGEYWSAAYNLTGTASGIVQIPFSKFTRPIWNTAGNGRLDLGAIVKLGIYVDIGAGPECTDSIIYLDGIRIITLPFSDNFEDYADDAGLQAAYIGNANGGDVNLALDASNKNEGQYGLKYDYSLTADDYVGVDKEPASANWTGNNGIRFWFKPDGSNHDLKIQFTEEGTGEVWGAYVKLNGIAAKLAEIPFNDFVKESRSSGNGVIDLTRIASLGIYVNKGSGTNDSGTIYIDSLEVAQLTQVEGFEYYNGDDARLQSGYEANTSGGSVTVSLDAMNKESGSYGMKVNYTVPADGYAQLVKKLAKNNWTGYNALKLWMLPDNTERTLKLQLKENGGELWEAYINLSGSRPGEVVIPFSNFVRAAGSNGNTQFDVDAVEELTLNISGAEGDGVLYLDSISVGNTRIVDNFEFYQNNKSLIDVPGGFKRNVYGGSISFTAGDTEKNGGSNGLAVTYDVGSIGSAGAIRAFGNNTLNWSGVDAIRFWIKPDGTNNTVTIQFREKPEGNDISSETWEAGYLLSGTDEQLATIPLSEFARPGWYAAQNNPWDNGVIDLEAISEFSLYVNKGAEATVFNSTIYFDDIEAVRTTPELSSNADLSDLTVTTGSEQLIEFDGSHSYQLDVANSVSSVTVTADKADSKASVTINGLAIAAKQIDLATGDNIITVRVTAEDGTTKDYIVIITRAAVNPSDSDDPDDTADTGKQETIIPYSSVSGGNIIVNAKLGNGGIANSEITSEDIRKALDAAGKDADGKKTVTIEVARVRGVTDYVLKLPATAVSDSDNGSRLSIKTPVADITVPSNMFSSRDVAGTGTMELSVRTVNASEMDDSLKSKLGGRPVIEISTSINGSKVSWSNENAPVTIAVNYTPTAAELADPEHIVVWYIDGSGNIIPVPDGRYDPATGKVTFTTTHLSKYAVSYVRKTFNDIGKYTWAKTEIEVLASKGIINGTTATTFNPATSITRADFMALLIKALSLTAAVDTNFSDVKPGDYYYNAVGIAKRLGITNGTGGERFDPRALITRQDAMVLVDKAMKISGKGNSADASLLANYADYTAIAPYAADAIASLLLAGIVKGSNNNIMPKDYITRAEAAVMIYRVYNK